MASRSARFGIAARRQQASFRDMLPVEACDCEDAKGQRNAHLLACGHECQNLYGPVRNSALEFFNQRRIKWWTSARSGDRAGDHPTRNLASSQIACVNFLLPLAAVQDGLATFLQSIDPDVESVIDIVDAQGNRSPLEFEWVGWDAPLEGGAITRGANQTSIDAFMVAETASGNRAYLLEWKYCEEYRRAAYKGAGDSGDTRRRRYQSLFESPDSPFDNAAVFDEFLHEPFYQIMRLLLLGQRMLERGVTPDIRITDAKVIVVCPTENRDYTSAVPSLPLAQRFPAFTAVEELVRANLKNPDDFALVAPEGILSSISRALPQEAAVQDWVSYHRERYGW